MAQESTKVIGRHATVCFLKPQAKSLRFSFPIKTQNAPLTQNGNIPFALVFLALMNGNSALDQSGDPPVLTIGTEGPRPNCSETAPPLSNQVT